MDGQSMNPHMDGYDLLAGQEVPNLIPEQVERFTIGALRAKPTRSFDPQAALREVQVGGEKTVVAVDIGGDKLIASYYGVRDGLLRQMTEVLVRRGNGGTGYLSALEDVAERASRGILSVGISFAGLTDGTNLVAGPNLPAFMAELHDRYGGNLVGLFPAVAIANDAEAGIMAGALEAARRSPRHGTSST